MLEEAEASLELRPRDHDLLAAASEAALGADETDLALWYAALALMGSNAASADRSLAERTPADRARDERMDAFLREAAGDAPLPADLEREQAEQLLALARAAERKKLYVNAVDLLDRARATPVADQATARLDKLLSKKKAVAALLASGVDVPVEPRRKKKPAEIARFDAKHSSWDDPAEFKGKYYTVRTDMGYAYGTAFLEAMEQMNSFYRQVFDYKTGGQTMRRCVLHVYGSRATFESQEPSMQGRPTTKGFFVPGENRVAAYDQSTDGGSIDDLWSTLFHEASHQFTHAVWPALIPTWLNEGTASYFEGAALMPGGRVEKNLVPRTRLLNLRRQLLDGDLGLKDVVTYFRPGSYPGEYYPFGWGLVYFCHNYEDENANRPYLPVYRALMESYVGAAKHDVFARFVEYFVTRADVEGVASFEDFEALWRAWILELAETTYGGPEKADVYLERGLRQQGAGRSDAAAESARRALEKRPGDPDALALLAESLVALERPDGALLAWRQLESRALEVGELNPERGAELFQRARAGIEAVDEAFAKTLAEGEAALAERVGSGARAWVEAGSPRVALEVLERAQRLLGRSEALTAQARAIRDEHGVTLARWQALPFTLAEDVGRGRADEAPVWRVPVGWSVVFDALLPESRGLGWCHWGESIEAPFELELVADVPAERAGAFLGLAYSGDFNSRPMAFVVDFQNARIGVLGDTILPSLVPRESVALDGIEFSLLVEVDATGARLFVDGAETAFEAAPDASTVLGGAVGVVAQGEGLRVTSMRVRRRID
ncbi:MAG: hypothetical protein AAFR54_06965 [Planctomycetota bacterium]